MKASHKTILLILSSLLMIVQCKKEEIQAQPIIPQTPQQLILGKWDLKYTLYKDPFDTFYFAQNNRQTTYHFYPNDTVFIETFINGTLDTHNSKNRFYEFSYYSDGVDSFQTLELDSFAHFYQLYNDTMTLDTRPMDGALQLFKKI